MRCTGLVIVLLLLGAPAYATESVYSRTSGSGCDDSGSIEELSVWQCPGPAGYSAEFSDEGNLVAFKIFRIGQRDDEPGLIWRGAEQVFGNRLEWRMSDGKPIAVILRTWRRLAADDSGHEAVRQEFLIISLRGQQPCKVGAINAREPHANRHARVLADSVVSCQADEK